MKHKMQVEWDHAAYYRKFHATLSYVQIGVGPPKWTWIGAISDNGFVYEDARRKPIGQWIGQVSGEPTHAIDDYPIVQFFYQSILPGAYRSIKTPEQIYYLYRRHKKSYKIGLSDETHSVIVAHDVGAEFDRVNRDINLYSPIEEYKAGGCYEVFTRKLVRLKTTLFADGESIGFMENGICMLRHQNFIPMVKPWLGAKWQIES